MVSQTLNSRCRQFYSTRIFHAVARLDVPTWDDPSVAAHINGLFTDSYRTNTWDTVATLIDTGSAFLRVLSQTAVLWGVLREQQDGLLLALSSFSSDLLTYFDMSNTYLLGGGRSFFTRADPLLNDDVSLGRHYAQSGLHQNRRSQAPCPQSQASQGICGRWPF
jgi:hypothetical protein